MNKTKTLQDSIGAIDASTYAKYDSVFTDPIEPFPDRDTKQYIVIRKDLHMRAGKIAVQASRASDALMATYRKGLPDEEVESWLNDGLNKRISVYVDSEAELKAFIELADELGWLHAEAIDVGITEFQGMTLTCAVIGPKLSDTISPHFKHLKLA